MQVGAWGAVVSSGKVNTDNQLFFKFGSVVGTNVSAEYTPWPGADAVKFNPSSTATTVYADYTTIPAWNGTNTTDGYISSDSYHTKANVLAGRGDPCKLVGLTITQIRAGTIDNGEYRLPTHAEMVATYSAPTYVAAPTKGIHAGDINTTFLPASGDLHEDGLSHAVGSLGHWWSACAYSDTEGYRLYFVGNSVYPSVYSGAHFGFPVRCVPQ
jgi:hypothetical protein